MPSLVVLERPIYKAYFPTNNAVFVFSPDEFDIVTNFPRRVLACKPASPDEVPVSLADAGFGKSEMLFVNDLDA